MKTVFDKATREELIGRINALDKDNVALWGKMNILQMLRHCTLWEEWVAGKVSYKRAFIGRIFGRMALKNVLKDDKPLGHNMPTLPQLRIADVSGDVAAEKAKWIGYIEGYANFSDREFVHAFFGKMTREQIGYMAYKHADHHLRQFNG